MKKLLAILLSLMMILSMAPSFAFANETAGDENEMPEDVIPEVLPDVYTLADFTQEGIVANKTQNSAPNGLVSTGSNTANLNQVDFFGYGDSNRSLEWNMQPMEFYVDMPAIDWAQYAYVNFRFYAPVAGQTFNYVYMGPDKFTSGKYYQKQIVTTGGWQVITVPVSDGTIQNAIKASADGKSIGYMIFSNNGWMISPGTPEQFANSETFLNEKGQTYTYKSILGEKIYFDKIWLEKANVDYLDADSLKNGDDDSISVIKSFASVSGAATDTRFSRSYENTRPGGASMFSMVKINPLSGTDIFFSSKGNVNDVNVDGYKYYNVWVYSPRPQSGGIVIWMNDTTSKKKISSQIKTVDWTGWKLLSYTLPAGDGDDTTGDVDEVKIALYGWTVADSKGYSIAADGTVSRTGKYYSGDFGRWMEPGYIGVECAYLSVNKPAMANKVVLPEGSAGNMAGQVNGLETDRVIYEASASDAKGQGTNNITANTTNARLYSQTARSRTFGGKILKETTANGTTTYAYVSATENKGVTNAQMCVYTAPKVAVDNGDGTTTNKYASDEINSNISTDGYLNLWWYNPSIKYDQFGNPSEYIFQVFYGVPSKDLSLNFGTDPKDDPNGVGNKVYRTIGIINNWEGWKLISIPLKDVAPDLKKDGYFLGQINIATNEWTPTADPKKATRKFTDDQLSQHYETAGGSYNTWTDKNNYFMIDKVWISEEKPANDVTVAIEHGLTKVSVATKEFTAQSSEKIGAISGEFSAYKRVGNEVTDVTDEFTFGYEGAELTATYNGEALSYDAQYIINWPEFYSVNGNKFESASSFYRVKTIVNEIGSFEVDQTTDTASISMKGNVPADLKDNVIVAAVYDVKDEVKTLANIAIAEYDAVNGEIKANIIADAGQVVTFMYLDSKVSVKPLAADVSYTK